MRLLFVALLLLPMFVFSQEEDAGKRENAIRVFIDCSSCDHEYLRNKMTFLNFVREQKEADVYIQVLSEPAGNDGRKYFVVLIGQQKFKDCEDTLTFNTGPDDTSDMIRTQIRKHIEIGLVQYVAKTPYVNDINLSYNVSEEAEEVKDPWNSWVFSTGLSAWYSGDDNYKSLNLWSDIDIERVTENLKVEFNFFNSYNEDHYNYEDFKYSSYTRSNNFHHRLVSAINDHWSMGYEGSLGSSLYSNYRFYANLSPAIEYNLFPYTESSHKQLRFFYSIGPRYYAYNDTTIYNVMEETLYKHHMNVAYKFVKKWGSVSANLSMSNFLHDFSKNRVSFWASTNIRLFKGFSFRVSGNISHINDQLSLSKAGLTEEEILLHVKQAGTSFSYHMNFGINYTFGSIYNNVVNPRFGY